MTTINTVQYQLSVSCGTRTPVSSIRVCCLCGPRPQPPPGVHFLALYTMLAHIVQSIAFAPRHYLQKPINDGVK